jgi:hypothetical protein
VRQISTRVATPSALRRSERSVRVCAKINQHVAPSCTFCALPHQGAGCENRTQLDLFSLSDARRVDEGGSITQTFAHLAIVWCARSCSAYQFLLSACCSAPSTIYVRFWRVLLNELHGDAQNWIFDSGGLLRGILREAKTLDRGGSI